MSRATNIQVRDKKFEVRLDDVSTVTLTCDQTRLIQYECNSERSANESFNSIRDTLLVVAQLLPIA